MIAKIIVCVFMGIFIGPIISLVITPLFCFLRKSFTVPVDGVYFLCRARVLEKDPSEGYPVKSILSASVIKRGSSKSVLAANRFIWLLLNGRIKKNILPDTSTNYTEYAEKRDLKNYKSFITSSVYDELIGCRVRKYDADKLVQDLNEFYANADCRWQRGRDTGLGINIAKQIIENQPTEDAQEVKHGKWEVKRYEGGIFDGSHLHECSVCSYKRFLNNDEIKYKTKYKFCPGCGAKMDLDVDEKGD